MHQGCDTAYARKSKMNRLVKSFPVLLGRIFFFFNDANTDMLKQVLWILSYWGKLASLQDSYTTSLKILPHPQGKLFSYPHCHSSTEKKHKMFYC